MSSANNLPSVVLVILTCNQKEVTLDCLKSLDASDYPAKEIVLVDNGSNDNTDHVVREKYPYVHIVKNDTNLGAAGGRNSGIHYARETFEFRYIMFMDNDIVVRPDFLTKLVAGLENRDDPSVEIASPMLYQQGTERIIDCAGGAQLNFYTGSTQTRGHGEEDRGQYAHDSYPRCVPTTVLMHRNALDRAGEFDVSFDPYGYEDLDFVLRANIINTPYLFVPSAVVYHLGSKTGFSGYTAEYARVKGKNLRRFLKRHSSSGQWVCFNALLPLLGAKTVMRELRRGNLDAVFSLAKGFLGK